MKREVLAARRLEDQDPPERRGALAKPDRPGSFIEVTPPLLHGRDYARPVGGEPSPANDEYDHQCDDDTEHEADAPELALERRQVPSKEVADDRERQRPHHATDGVVEVELPRWHRRDSGDH